MYATGREFLDKVWWEGGPYEMCSRGFEPADLPEPYREQAQVVLDAAKALDDAFYALELAIEEAE